MEYLAHLRSRSPCSAWAYVERGRLVGQSGGDIPSMRNPPFSSRRFQRTSEALRYQCSNCGAHVMCDVAKATSSGRCSTCGSYELIPIVAAKAAVGA